MRYILAPYRRAGRGLGVGFLYLITQRKCFNPEKPALNISEINAQLDKIKLPDNFLFDRGAKGDYDQVFSQINAGKNVSTEIDKRTINISGLFQLGASFAADGTLVSSDENFLRIFPRRKAGSINLGLISVQPGYEIEQVVAALKSHLQANPDVKVLTLPEYIKFEEDYWKNQSGSLQILGNELCKANVKQLTQARRTNGYIFQAHNLHGSLTAIQNVRMGLEVQGKMSGKEMLIQSQKMLEEVGLGNRLNYYPDNLSGGQKQRVAIPTERFAIARALVSQPKIVLADEPTAALDKQSGRDVVELMQKLAKEHDCTILLVTHDNRILDIADRIVYMEDGHLVREERDCLQSIAS